MGSSCCTLASASTAASYPTIASPCPAEVGTSCCNDPCALTAALGASANAASSSTAASASSVAVGASCSTYPCASTAASSTAASASTAEVGTSYSTDPCDFTAVLGASTSSAASSTAASASSAAVGASCSTYPCASTAASSTAASASTAEVGSFASTTASSTAASASTTEVGASYFTDPSASTAALGASTSSAASSSTAASASSAAVGASSFTDPCASTPAMGASTSTDASASTASQSYDVFINHRGVDVKHSFDVKKRFARSLYLRLHHKGLRAFLDQPEMQPGYNFLNQIKHAIETASVHLAIFSPNYAESRWCVDELLLMLESKVPIIPIFYGVKPDEVRWTKGKYGQYLKTLAEKTTDQGTPRYNSHIIEKWRNALFEVANNHGFELEVRNGEALELELLDKVIECLSKMVKKPDLYVAEYPSGLDDKVSDFENTVLWQQPQPQRGKPQIVGITGLGGVGKSTLAKQFFNRKKSDYPKSCFLSDIKDEYLTSLQRKLLKDLARFDKPIDSVDEGKAMLIEHLKPSNSLTRSHNPVDGVHAGKEMSAKHLESFKALIVLDDIDHEDQIRAILPLETHDFLAGSLILITSRNRDVLIRARVAIPSIYMLTGLNTKYSRELFCSHAFNQAYPPQAFQDLTDSFVEYCNGLPLSLKVIGAHLYGKEISKWEDELGRLPNEVKGKLKISYDALDHQEQQIFLDIACFLSGQIRDTAINIWNASGWKGRRGFQNLQDRCLVEVDSSNLIHMHEHLRDLGREIGEKSLPFRLWRWAEDVIDYLLQQPSGKLMVRGLKMDRSDYDNYGDYVLGRIGTMRLRILDTEDHVMERILGIVESPDVVLPQILWLRWTNCPYSSLPSWMSVKNVRYLEVSESDLNTLWQTENQSQLAEFLEELIIDSCVELKSISGLEHTRKLRLLDVTGCCELEELPSMETLTSLEEFYAADCMNLKRIRGLEQCRKLRVLNVVGCSELEELPNMETLVSTEEFYAANCMKLKRISGLEQCTKLRVLNVAGCSELEELSNMDTLASMEEFYAGYCVKLKRISGLEQCTKLRVLNVVGCSELEELPNMETLASMEEFHAGYCVKPKRISGLEQCTKLQVLNVDGCSVLEELPNMETLASMEEFYADGCVKLKYIKGLEQCAKLQVLDVTNCYELEELPNMEALVSMEEFYGYGCVKLKSIRGLWQLTRLRVLDVGRCLELEEVKGVEQCTWLEELDLSGCPKLQCPLWE